MELKFSVLMSIYYKENVNYFKKSMESILNQEIPPNEIVLVEDGALPDSLNQEIEKFTLKYKNIKVIKLEKNMGLGEALKIGILSCSNEIIARMDTDDIAKSNRFKKQIEIFKNDATIDIVGSAIDQFKEIDGKINIIGVRKVPETNEKIRKRLKFLNAFNHPTVMFKKSKVLLAGNYSEEFNKLEDYYLWVRMALNNCKFYNIQESLLYFRITEDTSKRRSGIKMLLGDLKLHSYFLKNNFINEIEFIRNIIFWSIYRIAPIRFVKFIKSLIM